MHDDETLVPAAAERRTARTFVLVQMVLLLALVVVAVVPSGGHGLLTALGGQVAAATHTASGDGATPTVADVVLVALRVVGGVMVVVGLAVVVLAATALGRGLTAMPLPNAHAQLRTGGFYRVVRHPVYAGLLLAALGAVVATLRPGVLVVAVLLALLLRAKARWEEVRLARRFPGYAAYAARTPRLVPGTRPAPLDVDA